MADNLNPSSLFNPTMLWADLGLRALDMSWSSIQNISDGVDRMTRAVAGAEPTQDEAASFTIREKPTSGVGSGLTLAAGMQRSAFDLMTRSWLQWMSTLGTVASLAAGRGFGENAVSHNLSLDGVRRGLQPHGAETPAAQVQSAGSSRQPGGSSREGHTESGSLEHGAASSGPKRRRSSARAKSKPRSRNS